MIKDIFFAIILIGISFFSAFHMKNAGDYDYTAILITITFFIASVFLIYRNLPKTDIVNKIDQFTNSIYLGKLIVGGLFTATVIFGSKYIMIDGSINWIKLFILVVFSIVVIRMVYRYFSD